MTKQYIPLTAVLESYKTQLSKVGIYDLRQLFETVQSKKINIYYQLANCDKWVIKIDFPLIKPVFEILGNFNIKDCELGLQGYSQCLNVSIDEKGGISFSHFFNQRLFDDEVRHYISQYGDEILIDENKYSIKNFSKYFNADNNFNYVDFRNDCFSGGRVFNFSLCNDPIETIQIEPCFTFDEDMPSITDTADNFYLLIDDVEKLARKNIPQETRENKKQTKDEKRVDEFINLIKKQKIKIIDVNSVGVISTKKSTLKTSLQNQNGRLFNTVNDTFFRALRERTGWEFEAGDNIPSPTDEGEELIRILNQDN